MRNAVTSLDRGMTHLNEGIEQRLVKNTKLVSIVDYHEKGVDTSIENNPTKREYRMPDGNRITIYSIFQRNNKSSGDGNPLLYALKKEKGYKFDSAYYEKLFWQRFELILDKFVKQYKDDIVVIFPEEPTDGTNGILIPSSNELNSKIAEIIKKKIPQYDIIDNVLLKISCDELLDACTNKNSYFYKYWHRLGEYEERLVQLDEYLAQSDYTTFTVHNMDPELRRTITNTLKVNPDLFAVYEPIINGSHILVIDDTITHAQTFKSAYYALRQCYSPKSITGLTMFSQKYNN